MVERRIKAAKFPATKSLDSFDFKAIPKLNKTTSETKTRAPRKARALPDHLPRVERVIEPASIVCPGGFGDMIRIGEDKTERLDIIPARYQVIVTIRPKYACPKGRAGVV